jgi:peptidoglycan/LPS O-acetylase OafA/YrhL
MFHALSQTQWEHGTGTCRVTDRSGIRADIQGMRALAVGSVLLYHLSPPALPGGYVGVDIFFVISGFLITSLLVRQAKRDGNVRFLDFYSRRIRRLLPASFLVIAAVAAFAVTLPPGRWINVGEEIIASSLYSENWYLAFQSVDYQNADSAAGPLQHFWSLGVEEQFYFIWPFVIWIGVGVSTLLKWPTRPLVSVLLVLIFGSSLYFSVTLTPETSAAYSTRTRGSGNSPPGRLLRCGFPRIFPPYSEASCWWAGWRSALGPWRSTRAQHHSPGWLPSLPSRAPHF